MLALGRLTLASAISVQVVQATQNQSRIFNIIFIACLESYVIAIGLYAIEQTEYSNLFDDVGYEAFRYSTCNY